MNWLDVLIILPLLFGLVRGLMRGLVSEVIAIAVVILGALGSRMWASQFSAWLLRQFAWPTEVCDVVAYILLFLAIAIFLSILAKLLLLINTAYTSPTINCIKIIKLFNKKIGLLLFFIYYFISIFNDH